MGKIIEIETLGKYVANNCTVAGNGNYLIENSGRNFIFDFEHFELKKFKNG